MKEIIVTISIADGEMKAIKVTGADAKIGVIYDGKFEAWQTIDSQTSYQPAKTTEPKK